MFDRLAEWLGQSGYLGIAALMFLENLFPPIPSELIMPSAGYSAGQGRLSLVGVIVSGTIGSVVGALFWYYVGKVIGSDRLKAWAGRHGRRLTRRSSDVDRVDRWFDTHSDKAVFFGRLVPAVRTLIFGARRSLRDELAAVLAILDLRHRTLDRASGYRRASGLSSNGAENRHKGVTS